MSETSEIINKVAQSGLLTIALEDWYAENPRFIIDLKFYLHQGLIIREADLRQVLKDTDWSKYKNAFVALCCTEDVIVPTWAYMLLSIALTPYAKETIVGDAASLEDHIWRKIIDDKIDTSYINAKVVIKGCTKKPVTPFAYAYLAQKLTPIAQSIMYGEPCSTVPLYKKRKA